MQPSLVTPPSSSPRKIALLGATGSIGTQTIEVVKHHADQLQIVAIAADRNIDGLAHIAHQLSIRHVGIHDAAAYQQAQDKGLFSTDTHLYSGAEGLATIASLDEVDLVVVATVGIHGIKPTLSALQAGKTIALANKEALVAAGELVMATAKAHHTTILPLDSEHNAIFQCLRAGKPTEVQKIILTASGGAFRDWDAHALKTVTVQQALKHPNWVMGQKVTIDSATLANKGLELIEAHWLFDVPEEQIEVVIHPQSIVHSMVAFQDGSLIAQLSTPSMIFPIQNSLLHPQRLPVHQPTLNLQAGLHLTFEAPDVIRFPALKLARQALQQKGSYPNVFNAANEVAVDAFIKERIRFVDIPHIIEHTLSRDWPPATNLEEVLTIDAHARQVAMAHLGR